MYVWHTRCCALVHRRSGADVCGCQKLLSRKSSDTFLIDAFIKPLHHYLVRFVQRAPCDIDISACAIECQAFEATLSLLCDITSLVCATCRWRLALCNVCTDIHARVPVCHWPLRQLVIGILDCRQYKPPSLQTYQLFLLT
jgi:hypothetical protein